MKPASKSSRGPRASTTTTLDRRRVGRPGCRDVPMATADRDSRADLVKRRKRHDTHACLGLVAAAGFEANLRDPQQPVQNILHGVDILNPGVRNVALVAEDEPARHHELVGLEPIPEGDGLNDGDERVRNDEQDEPCLPVEPGRARAHEHDEPWHYELTDLAGNDEQERQRMEPSLRQRHHFRAAADGCGDRRQRCPSGPAIRPASARCRQ